MSFKIEPVTEPYLQNTEVENIFINEYMTAASGDYVKVYLLALMCAQMGIETDNTQIARQCGLTEDVVNAAWAYWEAQGAVQKEYVSEDDRLSYRIEFVRLKAELYGTKKSSSAAAAAPGEREIKNMNALFSDKEIKSMYRSIEKLISRPLGGKEPTEILSWITDFGASPEVIVYGYSYCVRVRKKDSAGYVGRLVRDWTERGFHDVGAVEAYLQDMDARYFQYRRVLKALGMSRNATEHERVIMDKWFDEMNYTIDRVLEACSKTSGIPNPNINYVNKILENWYADRIKAGERVSGGGNGAGPGAVTGSSAKGGIIAVTTKYYAYLRKKAEQDAAVRREEVFAALPRVKTIEDELLRCSMNISRTMLSGSVNKTYQVNRLKNEAEALEREKEKLLSQAGYGSDYLEIKYRCPICGDTGMTDEGQRCSCFNNIMSEAEKWQNPQKN